MLVIRDFALQLRFDTVLNPVTTCFSLVLEGPRGFRKVLAEGVAASEGLLLEAASCWGYHLSNSTIRFQSQSLCLLYSFSLRGGGAFQAYGGNEADNTLPGIGGALDIDPRLHLEDPKAQRTGKIGFGHPSGSAVREAFGGAETHMFFFVVCVCVGILLNDFLVWNRLAILQVISYFSDVFFRF